MIGCCHFRSSVTYFCLLNKRLCYPVREHLQINYDPVRYLILMLSKLCSARIQSSMSFWGEKKSTVPSIFLLSVSLVDCSQQLCAELLEEVVLYKK